MAPDRLNHKSGSLEYDYVIVGAGVAGCILAHRLTEIADTDVLLIEAGGWPHSWRFAMPMAWPSLLQARSSLWRYDDAEVPRHGLVSGRVVGGSSSVNAMAYVRGHKSDYDRWDQAGLPGFSYESVLPYFRRLERWQGGADKYRGGDGPIPIIHSRIVDPALTALMQAADAQGARTYIDYNGAEQSGFGVTQLTSAEGRRASAASSFLTPALAKGRVRISTKALATRIVMENGRATAVEFLQGGEFKTARAHREIIVCCGAIQSPHLLMLSGIGPAAVLREAGIGIQADVPGVGQNLQNHVSVGLTYARRHPGPIHRVLRADRLFGATLDWALRGRGILTTTPNAAMGFVETPKSRGGVPDIQVLLFSTTPDATIHWPLVQRSYIDGFMLNAVLLRPESKGSVRLRSRAPADLPIVLQNILMTQRDREVLIHGLRRIDSLAQEPAMKEISAGPIDPTPNDFSPTALMTFLATTARPMFHPSGTCRMGPPGDRGAVVDPQFRINGVERIRVVDASVMPDLIGGNPLACVAMFAEMASDLIAREN